MGGMEAMGSMSGMDGMGMGGGVAEGEAGGIDTRRLWGGDFDTANAQADGANGMYCKFRGSKLSSSSFLYSQGPGSDGH